MNYKFTVTALAFALSTICLLPASVVATNSCYHYLYTSDFDGQHYSLIKNNSVQIGNEVTIISNCEYTFNSQSTPQFSSDTNDTISISLDTEWITITTNNNTYTYNNLTFYPASDFSIYTDNPNKIKVTTTEDLFTSELLAHIVTFAILFLMSTNVVYRLAQRKIDNTIEVII